MVERLVARSKEETQSALKKADAHLSGTYRDIGLATRRDLEDIDFRLRQLEHRVRLLESAADETASSESGSISQ
jgi:polyhydroxyalkanoate synthesis regulator phasin